MIKMRNSKFQKYIYACMLAALCCVATMAIRVPTIGTNGYVNIGDTIVLMCAWLIGGVYGALAAGIGSAMADLLAGYGAYVPGTFVIKFLMALVAAYIINHIKDGKAMKQVKYIASGIVAEAIMVIGYFLYESTLLGYGLGAAASIISNIIQGVTCLVCAVALINALEGSRYLVQRIRN